MNLYTPLTLGAMELPNRLVMAPLTRMRADLFGVPTDMMIDYYRQRASLGLIVSEGIYPSFTGQGNTRMPGLVTDEHVAGWKKVTDAVHAAGGRIVAQLMHSGRVAHENINGGRGAVAPSAIALEGMAHTYEGKQPYPVPHALTEAEIPGVVQEFTSAAVNAMKAGFDGVELHGANGYLLQEFLSPVSNTRTDSYGGSPENRARIVVEAFRSVAEAIGADHVGIRISPEHNIQGVLETDREDVLATYTALVDGIAPLKPLYLSILHKDPADDLVQELRRRFAGPVLLNTGFGVMTTRDDAIALLQEDLADAVVVGRPAIANPDLARRWQEDLELNAPDPLTFYTDGAAGYTDYPELAPVS
ncbi:alkene reductase [Arthrobacter luteolus]|uniref:alkene reductase n=1 Tax=Arthrobacter luteolus TaxID=98672 RepID=UPI0008324CCC|nr:alkene reductase [Arthrobacter luteolus]